MLNTAEVPLYVIILVRSSWCFEKEAITIGREYSRHKMNQCVAINVYGVSVIDELKTLVIFALFAYVTFVLYKIAKKFPKKA